MKPTERAWLAGLLDGAYEEEERFLFEALRNLNRRGKGTS